MKKLLLLLVTILFTSCYKCHYERECVDDYEYETRDYYFEDGSFSHRERVEIYIGTTCYDVEVCTTGYSYH